MGWAFRFWPRFFNFLQEGVIIDPNILQLVDEMDSFIARWVKASRYSFFSVSNSFASFRVVAEKCIGSDFYLVVFNSTCMIHPQCGNSLRIRKIGCHPHKMRYGKKLVLSVSICILAY